MTNRTRYGFVDEGSGHIGRRCIADGAITPDNICQGCAAPATDSDRRSPVAVDTVCLAAVGRCDAADTCDGGGTPCAADGVSAASTVYRPAVDPCDVAES